MLASQNGHEEVVKMLLSAGAEVDLKDKVSIIDFLFFLACLVSCNDLFMCGCVFLVFV